MQSNFPYTPLGDGIFVEPEQEKEETESGIILPEKKHSGTPKVGTILAVGSKVKGRFKVGSRVLLSLNFDDIRGFKQDQARFLKVKPEHIVAVIDKEIEIQ